jgi:hypothetical protein
MAGEFLLTAVFSERCSFAVKSVRTGAPKTKSAWLVDSVFFCCGCGLSRSREANFYLMREEDIRFRLTIPIEDALSFAMGETDLRSKEVTSMMRQVVGVLLIDALQYGEQWRIAGETQALLAQRWPGCPSFRGNLD